MVRIIVKAAISAMIVSVSQAATTSRNCYASITSGKWNNNAAYTMQPTISPKPTANPTKQPTGAPIVPTAPPSNSPTVSKSPSNSPSKSPSNSPTVTKSPSNSPSSMPTLSPTTFSAGVGDAIADAIASVFRANPAVAAACTSISTTETDVFNPATAITTVGSQSTTFTQEITVVATYPTTVKDACEAAITASISDIIAEIVRQVFDLGTWKYADIDAIDFYCSSAFSAKIGVSALFMTMSALFVLL